ncbi:hypothetical protein GGX14DRAFT_567235 [Mycena pura]|uniref:Uncharacterized protein n=1 Tax=Mycena pura TaxID=153505 RepID=A0AAD6VBI2_9AGAR|nr:hypothetical protein GGX14DRAFT_567235 [Mycena pura]
MCNAQVFGSHLPVSIAGVRSTAAAAAPDVQWTNCNPARGLSDVDDRGSKNGTVGTYLSTYILEFALSLFTLAFSLFILAMGVTLLNDLKRQVTVQVSFFQPGRNKPEIQEVKKNATELLASLLASSAAKDI